MKNLREDKTGDKGNNKSMATLTVPVVNGEASPLKLALSVREAAAALGVSPVTIRRLEQRGKLRANRDTRHLIFPVRELEKFLAQ